MPRSEARLKARTAILTAANAATNNDTPLLFMRHLQSAVCMVRRRRLVDDDVLVAAGFRAA